MRIPVQMKKKQISESREKFRHSGRIGEPPKPGRKRAVNVTVDEHVLADAKRFRLNLSKVLEDELRKRVTEEKTRRWQEEHKDAVDGHNRFIEKHGIWSEKYRSW
jgi:antitoxin CcdA